MTMSRRSLLAAAAGGIPLFASHRMPQRAPFHVVHSECGGAHGIQGNGNVPFNCTSSSLKCERGTIRVPTGPGFGIDIDPDDVNQARPMPG